MQPANLTVLRSLKRTVVRYGQQIAAFFNQPVYWGRPPKPLTADALIFFPVENSRLACGLAGIVAYKRRPLAAAQPELAKLEAQISGMAQNELAHCLADDEDLNQTYLGGDAWVAGVVSAVNSLKHH